VVVASDRRHGADRSRVGHEGGVVASRHGRGAPLSFIIRLFVKFFDEVFFMGVLHFFFLLIALIIAKKVVGCFRTDRRQ
jgi:hypothetical protein